MLTHLKSKRVFGVILWWTSVISHHHNQHDHHHDHNCVTCFSAVKARQDHQRWIEAQTKNSMETFEHDLQHSSPWKHLNHRNNNSNGNIQRWWSSNLDISLIMSFVWCQLSRHSPIWCQVSEPYLSPWLLYLIFLKFKTTNNFWIFFILGSTDGN